MLSRRTLLLTAAVPALRGQQRKGTMFGNAEAYERFMGRWSRLIAPLLADFADLPETGRIIDIGSGTGSMTFAVAERKARTRITGIDPSKEYVAYATSRNRFGNRTAFEIGDAQQLRFADATFDAGVSLLVFNFIPDPKKALLELRRVTKPGGRLAAAVWDYGGGMKMLRAFWDAAVSIDPPAEKLDESRMPLCRSGELSTLWRQGGLENVSERPISIDTRFESFPDYWDSFLLGQGPAGAYVASLGLDKLNALRSEAKRRLSVTTESAPLVLSARVWAVRGDVPAAG